MMPGSASPQGGVNTTHLFACGWHFGQTSCEMDVREGKREGRKEDSRAVRIWPVAHATAGTCPGPSEVCSHRSGIVLVCMSI